MRDVAVLAANAQLPILEHQIRQLEAECAVFKRDSRGMYDEHVQKFLHEADEVIRAQRAGHRVTWELWPNLDRHDVEACWDAMQAELDTLKSERDKLLILIAGETDETFG
jgi:hypothetical protein